MCSTHLGGGGGKGKSLCSTPRTRQAPRNVVCKQALGGLDCDGMNCIKYGF
jgi:hypothetical protein